jgi:hypothetical protein
MLDDLKRNLSAAVGVSGPPKGANDGWDQKCVIGQN